MKTILIAVLHFISTLSFAQKEKTVYLDAERKELAKRQKGEAVAFEIRRFDRKKRLNGTLSRYNMDSVLIEETVFNKGIKTGAYMSFNPAIGIRVDGEYENGEKTGAWVGMSMADESLVFVEIYEQGQLIENINPELSLSDSVMVVIETKPSFPGGPSAWTNFLKNNLRYPREATRSGAQGDVHLKFIVLKNGQVIAPSVIESPNYSLSRESLRIMKMSPNWKPATIRGKAVDSFMQIRIAFRLR